MTKRPTHVTLNGNAFTGGQLALYNKRSRTDLDDFEQDEELPERYSSLKNSVMLLTGHEGEIFTCKFHPDGKTLASAGSDRSICFWKVYGDCENFATVKNAHSNAILDLQFTCDGKHLFSCSADKVVTIWDAPTGGRLKKLKEHYGIVNALNVPSNDGNLCVSVGDDCQIIIWDVRRRKYVRLYEDLYPLTACEFSQDGHYVICGGIENSLKIWDLRKDKMIHELHGHTDTITGLSLSTDNSQQLLSNSMDQTLKIWDLRSLSLTTNNNNNNNHHHHQESTLVPHLLASCIGHQHSFEKNLLRCQWSPIDSRLIAAGSSDRLVYIWNSRTCEILYKLPGHLGSVNEVVFHPNEPIVMSCSSDKQIYLGEFEPL